MHFFPSLSLSAIWEVPLALLLTLRQQGNALWSWVNGRVLGSLHLSLKHRAVRARRWPSARGPLLCCTARLSIHSFSLAHLHAMHACNKKNNNDYHFSFLHDQRRLNDKHMYHVFMYECMYVYMYACMLICICIFWQQMSRIYIGPGDYKIVFNQRKNIYIIMEKIM